MKALKRLRIEKGLTLRELGDKVGMDFSTISKIENGERGLNDQNLIMFAKFFNVSTDFLLGIEKPEDVTKPNMRSNSPLKDTPEYKNLIHLIDMLDRDQLIMLKGMILAIIGVKDEKEKKVVWTKKATR